MSIKGFAQQSSLCDFSVRTLCFVFLPEFAIIGSSVRRNQQKFTEHHEPGCSLTFISRLYPLSFSLFLSLLPPPPPLLSLSLSLSLSFLPSLPPPLSLSLVLSVTLPLTHTHMHAHNISLSSKNIPGGGGGGGCDSTHSRTWHALLWHASQNLSFDVLINPSRSSFVQFKSSSSLVQV